MASAKVLTMPIFRREISSEQTRAVRLARLAMLVECEGSITIGMTPPTNTRNRPALSPIVGITNTATEIVDEAKVTMAIEGVAFTARPKRYGRGAGRKLRYDVNIHGFDRLNKLLPILMPYLRSKKRQAEIVLGFIRSRQASPSKARYSEYEWQLVTEIRKLNGRMPGHKAITKAKMKLATTDATLQPRTVEYFERYLAMCEELKTALRAA